MYYFFSFFIFLVNNINFFHYQTIHYSWHIIRIPNNYSSSKIQRIRIRIALFGTNYSNIRIIRIIRPNTVLNIYSRVGEIFFDPNIQLELTYVCIFIVKKCWQLSYKQNLSPWLNPQDSTKFYCQARFTHFIHASFLSAKTAT